MGGCLSGQPITQPGQAQGESGNSRFLRSFPNGFYLPSCFTFTFLATSDLHLFWEGACVCVCSDNNLSTPTGDRGLEGVGTPFLHSPGTLLKGPRKKGAGGARLTPTEDSTKKGASGPGRAALAGADVQLLQVAMVAPWGRGEVTRGWGR